MKSIIIKKRNYRFLQAGNGVLAIGMLWFSGFLIALIVVSGVGRIFCDSVDPSEWFEEIKRPIPIENVIHRHRSEGWADSRTGKFGLYAIPDLSSEKKEKVLFWGDSYVQAKQVSDVEKMSQSFTRIWSLSGKGELLGVGIGFDGTNTVDSYFMMPAYEKIAGQILCHIFVIHDFNKLCSNNNSAKIGAVFRSEPNLSLEYYPPPQKTAFYESMVSISSKIGIGFMFPLLKELRDYDWRFSLGEYHPQPHLPAMEDKMKSAGSGFIRDWNFLLGKLSRQTNNKIIFVYLPQVPALNNGKIVFQDSDSQLASEFARICAFHGMSFINMEKRFCDYFRNTYDFPRGFYNSNPYTGHLNKDGNEIVADEIVKFLSSSCNAVHSN